MDEGVRRMVWLCWWSRIFNWTRVHPLAWFAMEVTLCEFLWKLYYRKGSE